LVAANLSTTTATNIFVIIPFMGPIGQISAGFLVKYTKRYKWILVSGYALTMLGLGLSYRYINGHDHMAALVVSQIIIGFGSGVINTMQLGMQASVSQSSMTFQLRQRAQYTNHPCLQTWRRSPRSLQHLSASAVPSAGLLAVEYGPVRDLTNRYKSSRKNTKSSCPCPELLPRNLGRNLPDEAQSQLPAILGSVVVATSFEWGTPIRDAINKSYHDTFRTLLLIAVILQAFAIVAGVLVEDLNIKEVDEAREYEGMVIGKTGAVDAVKNKVRVRGDEVRME
jgi:hypothetical protein